MKFFPLIILLCWSHLSLSADTLDPEVMALQDEVRTNIILPFRVNQNGDINFFKSYPSDVFVSSPLIQVGFAFSKTNFVSPRSQSFFSLEPADERNLYLQIQRRKLEAGVGLKVLMQNTVGVGLTPYKGSFQRTVRTLSATDSQKFKLSLLPKTLREISEWKTGDYGSFDTYGGIDLYAQIGVSIISLAEVTFTLQNEFRVEIHKQSEDRVVLRLSEGGLKKRRLLAGTPMLQATFHEVKGRRLSAEFVLDLEDSHHHELYRLALQGKISSLQRELSFKSQKLQWQGEDLITFMGLPEVAGVQHRSGSFILNQDEEQTQIDFKNKRNTGILLPTRNQHRLVYHSENSLILLWAAETGRTNGKGLEKYFLHTGRALGLQGFEAEIEENTKTGPLLTEIGLSFRKSEILRLFTLDLQILQDDLEMRCEKLRLKCAQGTRVEKMISELKRISTLSWELMRSRVGKLLIREPALVHSMIKILKLKKKGYFYFLSGKFQSLEGETPVLP